MRVEGVGLVRGRSCCGEGGVLRLENAMRWSLRNGQCS